MPFDVSGNFTRNYNWVTDAGNGLKIQALRMDAEFDNYAVALNATFLRDGRAAMTGDFKAGNFRTTGLHAGTVGSPSLQFTGGATTGVYMPTAGELGLVATGVERLRVSTTGVAVTGTLSATGKVTTVASATGGAGLLLPHGTAPTTPANGELWTTTGGLYCRINGATVGPFTSTGTLSGAGTNSFKSPTATSNGNYSVALGDSASSGNTYSVALGGSANASGAGALAIGHNSVASATESTALGEGASATHTNSVAIGRSATTSAIDQIMLGTSSYTVEVPGGRLSFPATQVSSAGANVLDDYEEGSFTPGISYGGASVGMTYFSQSGWYTKIGRLIHAGFELQQNAKGSSTGAFRLTGLPFTPTARIPAVVWSDQWDNATGFVQGYADSGTTTISILHGATGGTVATETIANAGRRFAASIHYNG